MISEWRTFTQAAATTIFRVLGVVGLMIGGIFINIYDCSSSSSSNREKRVRMKESSDSWTGHVCFDQISEKSCSTCFLLISYGSFHFIFWRWRNVKSSRISRRQSRERWRNTWNSLINWRPTGRRWLRLCKANWMCSSLYNANATSICAHVLMRTTKYSFLTLLF